MTDRAPGGSFPRNRSGFAPAPAEPWIRRCLPVLRDLPGYGSAAARRDLTAAVTVAALAIPSAMAYAQVAGLSPVVGLYALLLPAVAYALLGSSRQLVVGPEGSLAALVGASVLALAPRGSASAGELAATLALLTAAFYGVAAVCRLGWIADYLSRPVLIGYIHGVAIVLIIGQLGKLLGVSVSALEPIPQLVQVARRLPDVSWQTLSVSAGSLMILFGLRRRAPRLPAALIALVAGVVASSVLHLGDHGVAVVGHIPSGLPSLSFPIPSIARAFDVAPAAIGLFVVGFADEILTARSYAGRHGQEIAPTQELLAMGAANAAAGFSGGMPVGASGSRTAVNDQMGARSQVAGLAAAATVAIVLLVLTGPLARLPTAVLGAAIVAASVGLVDPPAWRELYDSDRVELAIAAVTAGGVVVTGVLNAIAFAVGLSILDVVRRSARPHDAVLGWVPALDRWADVAVHRGAQITPGVVVYRLDDRLFFANAGYFKGRVREALRAATSPPRWLVLDAEGIGHIDSAGIAALRELDEALARDGIGVAVARMRSAIQAKLVDERIASDRFYGSVGSAVEACTAADRRDRDAAASPHSGDTGSPA